MADKPARWARMTQAGYSGTPLVKKLGLKPEQRIALRGAPEGFRETLGRLPHGCQLLLRPRTAVDLTIAFSRVASQLKRVEKYVDLMHSESAIWLAWPKKSGALHSDLDFASVQAAGLSEGLVDNKICAIDHDWSALRFVIPLKQRAQWVR